MDLKKYSVFDRIDFFISAFILWKICLRKLEQRSLRINDYKPYSWLLLFEVTFIIQSE